MESRTVTNNLGIVIHSHIHSYNAGGISSGWGRNNNCKSYERGKRSKSWVCPGTRKMTRVFYPILRYVSSSLLLFLFLMSFHIAECNIRECWRENSGFRIWSASSLPTSSPFLSTVAEDETLAVLRHVTRDTGHGTRNTWHVTRVHLVIGECSGLWRQLQGNHAANTYILIHSKDHPTLLPISELFC